MLIGTLTGIVLLLLIVVASVLYVPSLRTAVLEKGIVVANEQTDWDIDLGRLYLSPFHHSPKVLYRAYKGEADLPIEIQIDSLFVGHRGVDTLVYAHELRLRAQIRKIEDLKIQDWTRIPIVVDELTLETATFHSDSLIPAVGVDVVAKRLELSSPQILIAEGQYPLHGLRIDDAFVGIDLRNTTVDADSAAQDTVPLLMAFDIPDGELRNVWFRLTPLDMDIRTGYLATDVLVDVGASLYDARQLNVRDFTFDLGALHLPADTLYGNACVNLQKDLITSRGLHARSDELGATADLSTTALDLETMRIEVTGDAAYKGSQARLRGYYDIYDEAYEATVHIDHVDLTPFTNNLPPLSVAGDIEATGRGIHPDPSMVSRVKIRLGKAFYGPYNLSHASLEGFTDSTLSFRLSMPGLNADLQAPMPLMTLTDRLKPLVSTVSDSAVLAALTSLSDLTVLDTIRHLIPELTAAVEVRRGSPIQHIWDSIGVDFSKISLSLVSDSQQTALHLPTFALHLPPSLRTPQTEVSADVTMTEGQTKASLAAFTHLTDGAMNLNNICTDAALRLDLDRNGNALRGNGRLTMDSLSYGNMELGDRAVDIRISPSNEYAHALRADIQADDIPLDIVDGIMTLTDIALHGSVRAFATVDGLPRQTDISAEVYPLDVSAEYKPYEAGIHLGETPIVMKHQHIDLNGLPVYGADSTFISLTGGLDLNSMQLDISLSADSFAPVKLTEDGPIPVHGELATDVRGRVTGTLDSIVADVDVTILPTTDITYPIDKKNLAQVKPHGTVNVQYRTSDGALDLGGRIDVDDGVVRYSPKLYPVMPFRVDSGSHVTFHGPLGRAQLHLSASQKVKADVESEGEETRRVDFTTGVRVKGELDSLGLESLGFFLEAPDDETITRELMTVNEETREGLAATLLATGMYVGESNVAVQRSGYAISSIINSRINAAMKNSKMGNFIDVDISSAQSTHAAGKTNDMNIAISKSFFKDKLKITLGSTLTDNPEVNTSSGLLSSFAADYKLTEKENLLLRLFSQRDYNNILEGELFKSGLAVHSNNEWRKGNDSIVRIYGLTTDAGVAYRSNNSIGPDLTIKSSIKNVLGKNEMFTVKGNGAYYWALRNRHPGDPKKTDTYKLGLNASLVFPYLHWTGNNIPEGDTRYMLGYQYENIAGGYGVHKLSGSFTYFIHSANNPYVTHAFTPFSLSIVAMKAESDSLLGKAAEYPQLIQVLAGDEFVPSISYNFIYDDYRAKRAVNTFFSLGVKESGNLVNAIYCLFGHKWDEENKPLGKSTFNQFVKLSTELRNRFNFTDKVSVATRLYAGANIPIGNSLFAPLSEAFYTGGPNSIRACAPYAYGPGNFYSAKYNQNFFHAGDVKLEANFELRFPLFWKLYGAAFVDAGNVWNWFSTVDLLKAAGYEDYISILNIPETLRDGVFNNPDFARQIGLGTGAGLRLDIDGLVVRLDLGVGIHAPYQTFRYKDGQPDPEQPITTYYNMPSVLDALHLNFGIGYPF